VDLGTLVGAKTFNYNVIAKSILKSGCLVGGDGRRRRSSSDVTSDVTSDVIALPVPSAASLRCDIACPADSGCTLLGNEPGCTCDDGFAAVRHNGL